MLYLVVFHPEGEAPIASVQDATNEDAAWNAACEKYQSASGDDSELYLDSVETLESKLIGTGYSLIGPNGN